MKNDKFDAFLKIAIKLNKLNIIPLLMESVGLEIVTNISCDSQDLDIHVPGDKKGWEIAPELNIYNWNAIATTMYSMGYKLIDLHEHEFSKNNLSVEFGVIDTLPSFAGIQLKDLEIHETNDAKYYMLNPKQYLLVYEASAKDSYRNDNNNHKDFIKIEYLKNLSKH